MATTALGQQDRNGHDIGGCLYKRQRGKRGSVKKEKLKFQFRFCVLKNDNFVYYKSEKVTEFVNYHHLV